MTTTENATVHALAARLGVTPDDPAGLTVPALRARDLRHALRIAYRTGREAATPAAAPAASVPVRAFVAGSATRAIKGF